MTPLTPSAVTNVCRYSPLPGSPNCPRTPTDSPCSPLAPTVVLQWGAVPAAFQGVWCSLVPLTLLPSQVFSNEGQFRLRFGVRGRSPGQLQRPTGVSVDTNGDIIVADYDNRWVSVFSPEGKFKVRPSRALRESRRAVGRGSMAPPSLTACPPVPPRQSWVRGG